MDATNIAVNVARDLYIETLQNTSTSEGSNFGVSVTFTGAVPTSGSLSLGASDANRAWSDTVAGLFASGSNDIYVGELYGFRLTVILGWIFTAFRLMDC